MTDKLTLTKTTRYPDGVTIPAGGLEIPEDFLAVMTVDGVATRVQPGAYTGNVIIELLEKVPALGKVELPPFHGNGGPELVQYKNPYRSARRLPGNVNFVFEGVEGESMLLLLDEKGICASSGSACTSGSLDPSHVLLSIGLPHEVAHGSLRLTLCEQNTPEQVDYIVETVAPIIEYLRNMSPLWDELEKGERSHVI